MDIKYKGTIVQESLIDDRQLNDFQILKFRVTKDEKIEDRWHLFTVLATKEDIKKLSLNLKPEKWYAHFWKDAVSYGKSIGIPPKQLDFILE